MRTARGLHGWQPRRSIAPRPDVSDVQRLRLCRAADCGLLSVRRARRACSGRGPGHLQRDLPEACEQRSKCRLDARANLTSICNTPCHSRYALSLGALLERAILRAGPSWGPGPLSRGRGSPAEHSGQQAAAGSPRRALPAVREPLFGPPGSRLILLSSPRNGCGPSGVCRHGSQPGIHVPDTASSSRVDAAGTQWQGRRRVVFSDLCSVPQGRRVSAVCCLGRLCSCRFCLECGVVFCKFNRHKHHRRL